MKTLRRGWWGLVGFGFRLLYHEMAFTYDSVANVVSLGQWWDWQRAALNFLPSPESGPILDLAHGTGRFGLDLRYSGYTVTGLDISAQMGRIAGRRLRKAGLPQTLVRANAARMPFPARHFAAVVSTFPTPFIVQPDTLAEIRRILKSEGNLVFVPSAVLTGGGVAEQALESAYQVTGQRGGWGGEWSGHFEEAGFSLQHHLVKLTGSLVTVIEAKLQH